MIQYSERVLSVKPSATLAITAKAKELKSQGVDVVSLSAGEPDFDTPEFVKQAAIDALQKGDTKYTPAIGTLELREAICEKLRRDQGLAFDPSQIVVSCGAKHSLFNVLFALLNPEDEVLVPAPFWLSYPEMVNLIGGQVKKLQTAESAGFKLTPEILEPALSSKTKVLILNSPSNPTGAIYTKEDYQALAEVLKKFPDVVIISDEIYEKLIYSGSEHYSIAQVDESIASRTVIINGHSKAYSMTGWRLGYAACADPKLAKIVGSLQSHSTSNPTAFSQAGGVVALREADKEAFKMRDVFEKRRDWLFNELSQIPKIKPFKPQGAFYMFVNIEETGLGSLEFAQRLLEDAHVALVPGEPFGADQYVRMSFASSDEVLQKAVDRIRSWIDKLAAVSS